MYRLEDNAAFDFRYSIMKYICFCFAIILFGTCSRKTNLPAKTEDSPAKLAVKEETVDKPEEIVVEMEEEEEQVYLLCEFRRTSCYGKCPVYAIKLYSDGRAEFNGVANIEKIGLYEAHCDPQDFESLFTAAEKANYFVLRSQYPVDGQKLSDLPKTITYLKRNGLEKRIINNYDAPPALINFEKWLDIFFEALDWKPKG